MTTDDDTALTHIRFDVDRVGLATVLFDRVGASVNTLSPDVFDDFARVLERCERDPAVRAVVIGSAKPAGFIAGGDIDWLSSIGTEDDARRLLADGHQVLNRLERLHRTHGKPVVAAIDGPCLGGGLEVALACSGRIATDDPSTALGLPEVRIGLIPGGGGTQRLPRLVGLEMAVGMIVTGRQLRPKEALAARLIDEHCPAPDLMIRARRRALEAAGKGRSESKRPVAARARRVLIEKTALGRKLALSRASKRIAAKTDGHYPAPLAALRAIAAGYDGGMQAGLRTEAAEFASLLSSDEAVALTSIFFATRDLKRRNEARPRRAVEHLGIIGGGLMGAGIASVSATRAEVDTVLREVSADAATEAKARIDRSIAQHVTKRKLGPEESARLSDRIKVTENLEDLTQSDLVIEAVFEDLELKRSILNRVEDEVAREAIFASNTSSIPISEIASEARYPDRVVGMHYFSPVERMPLLEIVAAPATSTATVEAAVAFGRRQGKTVIVVDDGPGFYTTRILAPYAAEVFHLLAAGARVDEIDSAMVAWGFPVGPLALMDDVGIDVIAKIALIMEDAFGERLATPDGFQALEQAGSLGRKAGRGFYTYEKTKRVGVDDSVYRMLGLHPGKGMTANAIQERLAASMGNEAVRCLDDGVLHSAGDGDIGAVMGLGYPPFRGGPFHSMDREGLDHVVARLELLSTEHGGRFQPPPLLRRRAADGLRFRS